MTRAEGNGMRDLIEMPDRPLMIPPPLPVKRDLERHIVGIHVDNQTDFAAVWLSHDAERNGTNRVRVVDSVLYPRATHFAEIADDIKRRGEWIPIAWRIDDEDYAKALRLRGCSVLAFYGKETAYQETPAIRDVNVREIDERLTTGTLVVNEKNVAWLREYESFSPRDGQIPQEGFPLMSATRHAFHYLKRARKWPEPRKPIPPDYRGIV